mgnify:CR=1 FL=1
MRVFFHETGHAMRLEQTLPLQEAIQYELELKETILRSGFSSSYSTTAPLLYSAPLLRLSREALSTPRAREFKDQISDSSEREEWAEMVSFSLNPGIFGSLYPEKQALVKKYLAKFGVNLDRAKQTLEKIVSAREVVDEELKALHDKLMTAHLTPRVISSTLKKLGLN